MPAKETAVNIIRPLSTGLLGHASACRALITSKGDCAANVSFDCKKAALAGTSTISAVTTDGAQAALEGGDIRYE